jgi:hypothetical protein
MIESPAPRARLYADIYDSIQQALHPTTDDAFLYLARLRLDCILNRTIVLTDAQILFGDFFLNAANSSHLQELPIERLEIRCRASNLDEALLRAFADPNKQKLNNLFFAHLPQKTASHIRAGLGEYPSADIRSWRDIPVALKVLGLDSVDADRWEIAWARWIEVSKNKPDRFVTWSPGFDFDRRRDCLLEIDLKRIDEQLSSDLGKETRRRVWQERAYRSSVSAILDRTHASASSDEQYEVATIKSWYNKAYNYAAAEQHECDVKEVTDAPRSYPCAEYQKLYDQAFEDIVAGQFGWPIINTLDLFLNALGQMDGSTFANLLDDHRTNLRAWYEVSDFDSLRRTVDELVTTVDRTAQIDDTRPILSWAIPKMKMIVDNYGVTLGAIVGTMLNDVSGGLVGGRISKLLSKATVSTLETFEKNASITRCIVERARAGTR